MKSLILQVTTFCEFSLYYSLYFLTPSFFPFGALRMDGRTEGQISTPPVTLLLFFSTERAGPYPQAQLYWAGRTMGWMAD
jgi:hypothetical protein